MSLKPENPKGNGRFSWWVEKSGFGKSGYKSRRKLGLWTNQKTQWLALQTFLTIFLYGMLIAGAGALVRSCLSGWEKGPEVGSSTRTWKSKISIFHHNFCLEVVLVSWSFASILYRWNISHPIYSRSFFSQWRSTLQPAGQQVVINQSPICRLSIFLLLIGCLPFVRVSVWKSLKVHHLLI